MSDFDEMASTRPAPRKLASLGEMVGDVLAPAAPRHSFGLRDLDAATGGLQAGQLTLVAAAPGAGGSLLALAAARHTALVEGRQVLYAAAGLTKEIVTRWIIAAEAGVDLRKLRSGSLTAPEREATEAVAGRLGQAPLFFDDGAGLTAEAIAETAPYVDSLALIVVDRLHQGAEPHIPLSGDQVPPAVRTLTHLARQLSVPVLAVLNTDDSDAVRGLDADVSLVLAPADDSGIADVSVVERDFGRATVRLRADLDMARFADGPAVPAPAPPVSVTPAPATTPAPAAVSLPETERELVDAALAFTSGAVRGLPSDALQLLSDHRDAVNKGADEELPNLRAYTASLASAAGLVLPGSPEGQRLRAALDAFAAAHRAEGPQTAASAPEEEPHADRQQPAEERTPGQEQGREGQPVQEQEGGQEQDLPPLRPGDEDDEPEDAVFPALRLLKEAVNRSKMHPIPVIGKSDRDAEPWTLCNEIMDGEPRWVHPEVETVRLRGGKRRQLIVPDQFGPGQFCTIDRNGSYPSACSAVTLAPNKLKHTGPLEQRATGKEGQAGLFQIDLPAWEHLNMPHPLGRLADRPDNEGRVWVTTPHMEILEKLIRQGHLTDPLRIHDSWTGRANNSLLKPFYQEAKQTRTELVEAGGEPYIEYKRRLSIALRLLWPKGERVNSPFWRPDWRLSMVAEASVRHWVVAWGAVQDGHSLIALRNVDEAVFWTDGSAPAKYKVGTGFGEVKVKFEQADPAEADQAEADGQDGQSQQAEQGSDA
ncbi:DnaB-like helicase C-terminal domain-containing protein [Streptomyces sp. NPDC046853]|uniref:DnaB-like helicase C-terminal domain-containing protein n=1 Tax=Streptomyces sp. NPDC046853 TaxID=3154920 RepID=UPI00340CED65